MLFLKSCTILIFLFPLTIFGTENQCNIRLIDAAKRGDSAKIEELLSHDADINCIHKCRNAIYWTVFNFHQDATKVLINAGADLNHPEANKIYNTLSVAIFRHNYAPTEDHRSVMEKIIYMLLYAGADPNRIVGSTKTPYYRTNSPRIARMLALAGAKGNMGDFLEKGAWAAKPANIREAFSAGKERRKELLKVLQCDVFQSFLPRELEGLVWAYDEEFLLVKATQQRGHVVCLPFPLTSFF